MRYRRITNPSTFFPLAAFLALSALLNGPAGIYRFFSLDDIFGGSTLVEIQVLRWSCGFLSLLMIAGHTVYHRCVRARSSWTARLGSDFRAFLREKKRVVNTSYLVGANVLLLLLLTGILVTVAMSLHGGASWEAWQSLLLSEQGVFENLTALLLALAGGCHVWMAVKFRNQVAWFGWLPCAGLGLLYFFGAGEEFSWGQHLLGFATPHEIRTLNVQGEFNLHNIGGYWANQAMLLYLTGYVMVLPLLCGWFSDLRYLVDRLRIPIAARVFVPWGLAAVLMDERDIFQSIWHFPSLRLSEMRETLFAGVILAISVQHYLQWRESRAEPGVILSRFRFLSFFFGEGVMGKTKREYKEAT